MLKRGPADNLSDAFMYIIPAISLVFAVVHTYYNCDKVFLDNIREFRIQVYWMLVYAMTSEEEDIIPTLSCPT